MKWELAAEKNLNEILRFLLPREHFCTALTSKFYTESGAVWPKDKPVISVLRHNGVIEAVMYLSRRGLALPVFSETAELHPAAGAPPLFLRKQIKKIHTCIGTRRVVEILENYAGKRKHMVRYYLMVQSGPVSSSLRGVGSIQVRRAGPEHSDLLFPLHEGYEKEEVLITPENFNEKFHRLLLEKNLAAHMIFFALYEGTPAATAGTNAIGFSWCQLGSVYTAPELRKRGIATVLVAKVCSEINKLNKKGCLYVKQHNPAALALYRGLGFTSVDEYQISYFS